MSFFSGNMDVIRRARWVTWTVVICSFATTSLFGQAESPSDASDEKAPVTTQVPTVPKDQLELLLKPLTKEELITEANGWRDLLKAKVQEISSLRIALKQAQLEEEAAAESAEAAETDAAAESETSNAAGADAPDQAAATEADDATDSDDASDSDDATDSDDASDSDAATDGPAAPDAATTDSAEQAAEDTDQKKQKAETLAVMNEERAALVDRLNAVLDELEAKGGEVEEYRKYIASLTGIGVEVTDSTTALMVLRGWLVSEQGGQRWAWNIIKFLVILLAFYFGASIVAGFVRHAVSRVKGASQLLVDFLGNFVKQILTIIGLIVALGALEVDITPLLAAIGAAGFVIGFALQGTLSNFASGLLILAYRPFDVGDVIEASGVSGMVDSVTLFSTHIRSFDNKLMIVPNNDIWGGTITNSTASRTRRVDLVFGIGYDDDIETAKGILERLVEEHDLVLRDPAPVIRLHELADSSINFICRPWTRTEDYWAVFWDITRSVKEEFDRAGISIPYPQRDVHVYQQSESSGD